MSEMHIIRPAPGSADPIQPSFCGKANLNIISNKDQYTDYEGILELGEVPTCQECIIGALESTDSALPYVQKSIDSIKEALASQETTLADFNSVVSKLKSYKVEQKV